MTYPSDIRWLIFAALGAALFVTASCDLPGIPTDRSGDGYAQSDGGVVRSCPDQPRCGAGNFVEQCAEDGTTFEVVSCGLAEVCRNGSCADVTDTCDSSRGRPYRLSKRELVFDVPELGADCDCSGPTGCVCNDVVYDSETKSVEIENCSERPLFLQETALKQTSLRPDGTPVFVLDGTYASQAIEPGTTRSISVTYRPAPGVSQLAGSDLSISLIGDAAEFFTIPLRTRSFCVTSTPTVDAWTLIPGQKLTREAVIQNCGTEPVTLIGAEVAGWKGPAEPLVRISEKPPYRLAGGEQSIARIELAPEAPGLFEGTIRFTVAEEKAGLGSTTRVSGAAADNGCSDAELPELTVFANGTILDDSINTLEPAALVTMAPTTGPSNLLPVFILRDKPTYFVGRPVVGDDSTTIFADIAGAYSVRYSAFDEETGFMTCDHKDVDFEVRPTAPLYVELTWRAVNDSIVDDAGFGRGADLDLYVRATSTEGDWTSPESACFPGSPTPCSEGRGGRVSVSRSGWNPEAYRFEEVDGLTYSFGAYLRNPFNFGGVGGGVRASLKVWRNGELVPSASRISPADPDLSPRIRSADFFWWASTYEDGSVFVIDSYQPGLP